AGPLWRDEISSLALSTKPTLTEFWKSLPLDPFPASYFLLLRGWNAVGLGSGDLAVRGLGLVIGLSLIAALWWSCYLIDKSVPLWPLALFGFSPLALEGGDSVRSYGFGLIWILLAFGFIWRIVCEPSRRSTIAFASIVALLSVQSLFPNALMLFALGAGAAVILLKRRGWLELSLISGISGVAALSLLFYLPIIYATRDWAKIIANKNDVGSVLGVGRDAIADAGTLAKWIWFVLGAGLLVSFLFALSGRLVAALDLKRDRMLFAGATLSVAIGATIVFLCAAQYLIFPRYFLPAMAVVPLCIHSFLVALPRRCSVPAPSLFLAIVAAGTSIHPLYRGANMRMTNCDQIAAALEQRANSEDLIVVTSFLYGVSFQRYYRGNATWVAVPQVADFSLHRWDLLKEAMARSDPVLQLLSRAETVLRSGHKVFLVGKLGPPPVEQPEPFPPAPKTEFGWQMEPYLAQWKSELTYWIEHHALHGTNLSIEETQLVNPLEHLGVFEVSGWRER